MGFILFFIEGALYAILLPIRSLITSASALLIAIFDALLAAFVRELAACAVNF